MTTPSNIEAQARALCERQLSSTAVSPDALAAAVERFWHCVAAEIEAGLIDDDGHCLPHSHEQGLAAYRDWKARHP